MTRTCAPRVVSPVPQRVFVIGDLHGCTEELDLLIDFLSKESLGENDLLVFVGDYIDRGPDSRGVVERLLQLRQRYPQTIFLRGNHEDMLAAYLSLPVDLTGSDNYGKYYLYNGGVQFLESYGITPTTAPAAIVKALPGEHVDFLCNLESFVQIGDFIVVHAGLNSKFPLDQQQLKDLFWIRDEFIFDSHDFGKTVVFGHTPYENVFVDLPLKVGIDTGLVYGNALTCYELLSGLIYRVERGDKNVMKYNVSSLLKRPDV